MKQKSIEMAKSILVYCMGLFIMAMGVSFSGTANLGMSPVNSIPYVLSEIFTALSMGTWIIIIFSLYILIQFIILGRNFQPWRVLQLVCTTLFGYFTDFTNMMADIFFTQSYLDDLFSIACLLCKAVIPYYQYDFNRTGHFVLSSS